MVIPSVALAPPEASDSDIPSAASAHPAASVIMVTVTPSAASVHPAASDSDIPPDGVPFIKIDLCNDI